MIWRHRLSVGMAALVAVASLLLPVSANQKEQAATALAPIEIVVEGLGDLRGIAVSATGAVFVTDMKWGRLLQVEDSRAFVVIDRLKHPWGIATDPEGRPVVVEAGRRRILRVEAEGESTTLASGLKHPRWIAGASEDVWYVTAKRLAFDDDEEEEEEEENKAEPEVIVRVAPDGRPQVFADRFQGLQGLAVDGDLLAVAARGRKGERHAVGALYEIPIEPDGRAGPVTPLVDGQFLRPVGLASDRLGARFVSAESLAGRPWHRHVIVRVSHDGSASLFAEGLRDPRGLAFGPDGSLYLADGSAGRVLRFVSPRPPLLEETPPVVTRDPGITLRLTTEIGASLTVLGGQLPVVTTADHSGSAVVSVTLRPNRENQLMVFATGAAGLGLTSEPLEVSVIHDDQPPTLELSTPQPGALVRGTIPAEARAADLNGIAQVEFRLDDSLVGLDAAPPYRASVDTTVVGDGPRIMSALARDRAGNAASATAQVTVDNTPPDVRIAAPASGVVVSGPVEIVVEAADVTSGVARVELAVNGVSRFIADVPPYRFQFDPQGFGAEPYVLVAAATDHAGNRAESAPVSVVRSSLTVAISEPGEGAQLPAGPVLVKGRVEAGGAEVGVMVNGVPAAVQGTAFAALVPLTPDTTSLTAVATTAAGVTASHGIAITVSSTAAQEIDFRATPSSGVAPLTVAFSAPGIPGISVALDLDGNGTTDFTGPTLEGQTFTYAQPGLYFPTVIVTDARGNQLTARALVQVYDADALDALLQARWTALKGALLRSDAERALQTVGVGIRDRYRPALQVLATDLPALAATLGDLQVVSFLEGLAEAATVRLEDGQRRVYFIYFAPDDDGIWRILGM